MNLLDIPLYRHRYCFVTVGNQRFVLIVLKLNWCKTTLCRSSLIICTLMPFHWRYLVILFLIVDSTWNLLRLIWFCLALWVISHDSNMLLEWKDQAWLLGWNQKSIADIVKDLSELFLCFRTLNDHHLWILRLFQSWWVLREDHREDAAWDRGCSEKEYDLLWCLVLF